jgi:hypothetical protein
MKWRGVAWLGEARLGPARHGSARPGKGTEFQNHLRERNRTLIYLASPYSHPNPAVRKERLEAARKATERLFMMGRTVYSPIIYTCALLGDSSPLPTSTEYWIGHDLKTLARYDVLYVLLIEGVNESVGVQCEIGFANENGIPVWNLEPETLELTSL